MENIHTDVGVLRVKGNLTPITVNLQNHLL